MKLLVLLFAAYATNAATPNPPGGFQIDSNKAHPGNYATSVLFAEKNGVIPEALYVPGTVGVQVRRDWKVMEKAEGVYDWAQTDKDLASARAHGRMLIVMINDKSYSVKDPNPLPAYLAPYTVAGKNSANMLVVKWDPFVAARLKALVKALGDRYDGDPNFEGIAFQETALSMDDATMAKWSYTPEKYRDVIISTLNAARASFPRSRVFWYMNFLQGGQSYLRDIAKLMVGTNVVMGGPDVLPESSSLVKLVYPLYTDFAGKLVLFGSMQNDSYRHPKRTGGIYSMEEMFVYARDVLRVSYVFWEYRPSVAAGELGWSDAVPVIARHPTW